MRSNFRLKTHEVQAYQVTERESVEIGGQSNWRCLPRDWVVTYQDGSRVVMSDTLFRQRYERIDGPG